MESTLKPPYYVNIDQSNLKATWKRIRENEKFPIIKDNNLTKNSKDKDQRTK